MSLWTGVLLASVICLAIKYVGYLVPVSALDEPKPARTVDAVTVGLLAALAATQTLTASGAATVDARLPAVIVAGVLLYLKQSFLVVVLAAALVAAGLRLLGWAA